MDDLFEISKHYEDLKSYIDSEFIKIRLHFDENFENGSFYVIKIFEFEWNKSKKSKVRKNTLVVEFMPEFLFVAFKGLKVAYDESKEQNKGFIECIKKI